MVESLLAAETLLSCLNRYVPKQELNLLKLSACPVNITERRCGVSEEGQGP